MKDAGGSGGGSSRPWLEVGRELVREYERPLLTTRGWVGRKGIGCVAWR